MNCHGKVGATGTGLFAFDFGLVCISATLKSLSRKGQMRTAI
jgi:hypothetical protein